MKNPPNINPGAINSNVSTVEENTRKLREGVIKKAYFHDYDSPIFLLETGYSRHYPKTLVRTKSHMYCVEYVTDGEGFVISDDKSYKIKKGDIFILHRNTYQKYGPSSENPYSKIHINVSGSFTEHCINDYGLNNTIVVRNLPIKHLFEAFYAAAGNESLNIQQRSASLAVIFLEIIQQIAKAKDRVPAEDNSKLAQKVKNYIDGSTDPNLDLDNICAAFYCSKTNIIHKFTSEYGITPYRYIIARKLEMIKQKLLKSDRPISEIASEFGFCSSSYFTKFFKRETGMIPAEYKKMMTEGNGSEQGDEKQRILYI